LNTHAPLNFPGMLSTAGHWDQSSVAITGFPSISQSLKTTILGISPWSNATS
jgi:hypothetical protein